MHSIGGGGDTCECMCVYWSNKSVGVMCNTQCCIQSVICVGVQIVESHTVQSVNSATLGRSVFRFALCSQTTYTAN